MMNSLATWIKLKVSNNCNVLVFFEDSYHLIKPAGKNLDIIVEKEEILCLSGRRSLIAGTGEISICIVQDRAYRSRISVEDISSPIR
jgi:hypothetical protein